MDGPPNIIYKVPIKGTDVGNKISQLFDDMVSRNPKSIPIGSMILRTTDGNGIYITREHIGFIKYNLQN